MCVILQAKYLNISYVIKDHDYNTKNCFYFLQIFDYY